MLLSYILITWRLTTQRNIKICRTECFHGGDTLQPESSVPKFRWNFLSAGASYITKVVAYVIWRGGGGERVTENRNGYLKPRRGREGGSTDPTRSCPHFPNSGQSYPPWTFCPHFYITCHFLPWRQKKQCSPETLVSTHQDHNVSFLQDSDLQSHPPISHLRQSR